MSAQQLSQLNSVSHCVPLITAVIAAAVAAGLQWTQWSLNGFCSRSSGSSIMKNQHCAKPEESCQYQLIKTVFHKKETLIFDYSYRIYWSIFTILAPMETRMNTPQYHVIYILNCLKTS